jgi:cell wall assembly regulator SMI1
MRHAVAPLCSCPLNVFWRFASVRFAYSSWVDVLCGLVMNETWNGIERWLSVNAPRKVLPAGASEADLRALENGLQSRFPDELRESYLIHNGSANHSIFLNYYLMSVDQILQITLMNRAALQEGVYDRWPIHPSKLIKPVRWSSGWITILDDGTGNHVCLDLDPAANGTYGQIITVEKIEGPLHVLGNSFRSWVTTLAADLEAGKYALSPGGDILAREEV